jgi:hypothetical protein
MLYTILLELATIWPSFHSVPQYIKQLFLELQKCSDSHVYIYVQVRLHILKSLHLYNIAKFVYLL